MNRLNSLCAYCPLYEIRFDRDGGVGWFEKVTDDPYPRLVFAIRDAVRRPSGTTFDNIPLRESKQEMMG